MSMTNRPRSLTLRLEEGGDTFELAPVSDRVNYYSRQDILLCQCDRPLILEAAYSASGRDEGSMLCALADRYEQGSLLGQGRLPAMVDVLVVHPNVRFDALTLADGDATFAYTGVLADC